MKVYVGLFIVALAASSAAAQDTPPTPTQAAKVNAELAAGAASGSTAAARMNGVLAAGLGSSMKNSPFSAEEVNESVQTLADGNRIVHNSTSKMYRNSEGRIRRESRGGAGGSFGFTYTVAPSVSIVDPVLRQQFELNSTLRTATISEMKSGQGVTVTGSRANEELLTKLKAEGKSVTLSASLADAVSASAAAAASYAATSGSYAAAYPVALRAKDETRTEELGTRDFEGVMAVGTRRTTIIAAGAIGNDRPIETVYERWYSKDLGVVVYSRTVDPRMGEQTYKLTNIVRSEPDPSLFAVPTEYKKIGQSGATYRVAPAKPIAAKSATTPKSPTAVGRP